MGPTRNKRRATTTNTNESSHDSDDDYRQRRQRNNIAVKKSREKSRSKAQETAQRVSELRRENSELEGKIGMLSSELKLLKDVLLTGARKGPAGENRDTAAEKSSANASDCPAGSDSVENDHIYTSSRMKR